MKICGMLFIRTEIFILKFAYMFKCLYVYMNHCGEWRIRTPGTRKGPPVFKTGAFDRSANSPCRITYNAKRITCNI